MSTHRNNSQLSDETPADGQGSEDILDIDVSQIEPNFHSPAYLPPSQLSRPPRPTAPKPSPAAQSPSRTDPDTTNSGNASPDELPARAARYAETHPPAPPLATQAPVAAAIPADSAVSSAAVGEFPQGLAPNEEDESGWFGLFVRETLETVILAVLIFLVIRVVVQNYRIQGQSMEPNFQDGQYLLVNKLAYRLGEYSRGDVIVFRYPNDPSKDYIKRVVGLPGDTVEIRDGVLYVNGEAANEPYNHFPMVRNIAPQTVEAGNLYVLGDNRPASSDTRSWGQLDQSFVIGKAWLAIWPFEDLGLVEHPVIELGPVMARGP